MAAKTNSATVDKFISDILDCVRGLKEQFQEENVPVTDDNILVQKFCSKLEFILQNGLKDKTSILGNKKDYWDYICQCLASRKYVHDGIRYVKLNSEVKTSKGKGRAFLRFCLVHGCLADSLQQCFVHEATRDWYQAWAFPLQRDQWTAFISKLYDLSDVIFDLSPDCFDLDVTWPTFSRRVPDSRISWRPPSRSISISSLNSQVQMEHPLGFASGREFPECEEDICEESATEKLKIELDQSELSCTRLRQQLEQAQASEAELRFQVLQLQPSKDQTDSILCESKDNSETDELVQLRLRIAELETQNVGLESKLSDCELQLQNALGERNQMASVIDESEAHIQALKEKNAYLDFSLEQLKVDFEAEVTQIGFAAQRVSQLESQLSDCEEKLKGERLLRTYILSWLDNIQSDNENTRDLQSDLGSELSELTENLDKFRESLSENEKGNLVVEKAISTMSLLQRKLESSRSNEIELQNTHKAIQDLEAKIEELTSNQQDITLLSKITDIEMQNISLTQELQATTNNFQCQITSLCLEKDELNQTIQKMMEKEQTFVTQMQEKNEALSKVNKQLVQFEQMKSVLGPLYGQQENVSSQLAELTDILVAASEKLRDEIKTLGSILFCIAKGNYVTWEPKEENEVTDGMDIETSEGTDVDTSSQLKCTTSPSPIVHFVNDSARTISKIKDLCKKSERMEIILQTCDNQCRDLIALSREHQKKLALQHFDVQGTQRVVDTLTKEHKKLQTAEAILKYELREKKKLLSNLRHQVESAREEWNRSRIKTAQSELEWHNLREEFAVRHKQSSEESGFVDDRNSERAASDGLTDDPNTDENLSDQSEMSSAPPSDTASDENVGGGGDISQGTEASSSVPSPTPSSSGEGVGTCPLPSQPRSRLDMLEEQYQLLYSSLVRSSKRSEALEQRIEVLLSNAETHSKSRLISTNPSEDIPVEPVDVPIPSEDIDADEMPPSEDLSQSSISLENIPESESSMLHETVSEESLDSEGLTLLSNGEGLHSYGAQWNSEESSEGNEAAAREPVSDLRKRTLENFVTRLKDEKIARNAKEADLRAEIQVLLTEKLELESKVLSLQQEKQLVWNKESEFRKRAEFIFRQERDSFESKLSSLSQERLLLMKEVEKLKSDLTTCKEQQEQRDTLLKESQREFSEKESSLKSQIETLKFQMSTEAIKFERALKQYNEQESGIMDMKEKVYSQEAIIESLEESLREIREERRMEQDKQWEELEELQVSLSTRDEECSAMNEELKRTVRDLDETRNQLDNLQAVSQQAERDSATTVAHLETVLAQTKSDNEGLKKQIIKLVRDKDLLWKRTEALSNLQFSPTRDRWMADSEVNECLGCKSTFSFTLRKHHCRLCGRIFCHDCVNHWVMTASSSRRTRICSECYSEHIEKATSKQPSLADQEGSEEEQQDTVPQLVPVQAPSNASFDSSSVDSLPISTHRDSSPSVVEALAETDGISRTSEGLANTDQTFHTESSKMDFDVISDEEISRSLSACSPYSPAPSPVSGTDPEIQTTATRTIQDIISAGPEGVSGEIWINAGSSYTVPVLLDKEEVILSWEFKSEPKSVAFSVVYREESSVAASKNQEILLQTTHVQSHLQPAQGHLIAKHSGLYSLVFSNQFSRYMAKKVSYTLRILNFNDENSHDSN